MNTCDPKPLDFFQIDQFARGAEIPVDAVTREVIARVRKLDEKTELEPALRGILGAPDETPHGPTELEDIFHVGVTVRGVARVAAFIIKGKSFEKVTSKLIGNQILRLQDVPDLGLAVLCAVGHIHDDAKKHFIQTSIGKGADYLVMDAMATARLLIAYERICPRDGEPYNSAGMCPSGHQREGGATISWRVKEDAKAESIRVKDMSTANAKRYSAFLIVDRHYDRALVRWLVADATEQLKSEKYQRPGPMRELWANEPPHVIWTYVARNLGDIDQGNWVCRSLWIDPKKEKLLSIQPLGGDEKLDGIEFAWNPHYQAHTEFVAANRASKGEVMERVEYLLNALLGFAAMAQDGFGAFSENTVSEAELARLLQPHCEEVRALYHSCSDVPFGSPDTNEVVELCGMIGGSVDEMFDSYSVQWMKETASTDRRIRFEMAVSNLKRDLKRWEVAWEKVHHG